MVFGHHKFIGFVVLPDLTMKAFESLWEPQLVNSIFQAFRSPAGEEMVIEKNLFVEAVLPGSILQKLSDDEVAEYRRPFRDAEHRRPTLTWPREIPIEGEPADVA